mmetsp:Transcript_43479/g.115414  ORF Transcript_43479/g.115414 Transcript_43479/m.115414 type:complete len:240 (+) Transcript_43479:231-950(+)
MAFPTQGGSSGCSTGCMTLKLTESPALYPGRSAEKNHAGAVVRASCGCVWTTASGLPATSHSHRRPVLQGRSRAPRTVTLRHTTLPMESFRSDTRVPRLCLVLATRMIELTRPAKSFSALRSSSCWPASRDACCQSSMCPAAVSRFSSDLLTCLRFASHAAGGQSSRWWCTSFMRSSRGMVRYSQRSISCCTFPQKSSISDLMRSTSCLCCSSCLTSLSRSSSALMFSTWASSTPMQTT